MTRPIELLSPARTAATGKQAILHGADAVYIGAEGFGARKKAANSLADIAELVDFAHQYRARVYVTVNTVVFDHELSQVEKMIDKLYRIGVDALIVQDPGILRLNIPPIALHASTQCDTRTPEKARFWQDAGFSQIVLARELTLEEIRDVCNRVTVPVEVFVHGALCVCYSGRCQASLAAGGRSANRGECAQICRLPWTLSDANGKVLSKEKHLLSLRDLNLSASIPQLLRAGVSSFKIEGRLKDDAYVKNITALYRQIIDSAIAKNPELYHRSSKGTSHLSFQPEAGKSFNRGFTHYFTDERKPRQIANILTPKSMGEPVRNISDLHNGDGISWFDRKGHYVGAYVNGREGGRLLTSSPLKDADLSKLRLTYNKEFETLLKRDSARRTIAVDMILDSSGLTLTDERGCHARVPFEPSLQASLKPADRRGEMGKLGGTIYELRNFKDLIGADAFIPYSQLSELRRRGVEALDQAAKDTYSFDYRRQEKDVNWPGERVDYRDNVNNRLAAQFMREHGVKHIEPGADSDAKALKGRKVMTCRHCILRELGRCLQENRPDFKLPLTINNGETDFELHFDCKNCEMSLIKS